MEIGVVYSTMLVDIMTDVLPVAFLVFGIRLIFNIVYSALNGRVDI